ncbi:tetratricopeptide repeat protein [Halioglobus maricola]|uniref:tetratricopeptide repeat protein n=1 Tax=Halioglobus maricola TaxID=2601894 RepID=UPI00147888AE|nr:tetratricopeptide repeat protein [Halioglobus maricola]
MHAPVLFSRLALGASILVIAACGTNPYSLPTIESSEPSYEEPSAPSEPAQDREPAPDKEAATGGHNVLIDRAIDVRAQGDYDRALGYLQRAQRIDPDDAEIYLELARTHSAMGNEPQAKAVAERGLLYCSGKSQCSALKGLAN